VKLKINFSGSDKIKEIEINNGLLISDLLKKINLNTNKTIVLRNNTPIPIDEKIIEGEILTIIEVSSGG